MLPGLGDGPLQGRVRQRHLDQAGAHHLLAGPKPANHFVWKDLTSLTLTVTTPNTPPGRQKNVKITREELWAQDTNNNWHKLFDKPYTYVFADGYNDFEMFVDH
ncbi:hypothetical protein ACE1OC_26060 [Streptomyces sp. DSM 116496]|uniref:hypothetical protein n=1 Tax=Streptomyces stoeckheimensis TaxID=3344656 RepID=UPI0038B2C5A8